MKIETQKFDSKILFTIDTEGKDINDLYKTLKKELDMYDTGSLYHTLRFVKGIVHHGEVFMKDNFINIIFTTSSEYMDDLEEVSLDYFNSIKE